MLLKQFFFIKWLAFYRQRSKPFSVVRVLATLGQCGSSAVGSKSYPWRAPSPCFRSRRGLSNKIHESFVVVESGKNKIESLPESKVSKHGPV